jgi:hypothetical protein
MIHIGPENPLGITKSTGGPLLLHPERKSIKSIGIARFIPRPLIIPYNG